jgi:hypothetical protein
MADILVIIIIIVATNVTTTLASVTTHYYPLYYYIMRAYCVTTLLLFSYVLSASRRRLEGSYDLQKNNMYHTEEASKKLSPLQLVVASKKNAQKESSVAACRLIGHCK